MQEAEAELAGGETVRENVDSRDGVEEGVVCCVDERCVRVGDGNGRVEDGDLDGAEGELGVRGRGRERRRAGEEVRVKEEGMEVS